MDATQAEGQVVIRQTTPKGVHLRPKYVMRWLTGFGIPNLRIDGRRITGLSGITIVVGAFADNKQTVLNKMMNLPSTQRRYIHIVPTRPGDSIQDSIGMVRLDFLAELLNAYIEANGDRLFRKD